MKKSLKRLVALWLAGFGLVSMALPQEYYFFKAPEDRDIRVAWLNRVKQPPDLVLNLKDLPAEQAIPRIGWFMSHLNRPTAESQRIGRQEILKFPEWRKILSDKLEALSQIKTPPDLFGPDWRRLSMSREMAKQRDDAKWGGFKARSAQGEIFELLTLLKTPEAALLISPYLFDTSLGFTPDGCVMVGAPNSMAWWTLHRLPVPEKPAFKILYPDHNTQLRAWQEWWLRMAPAFGAEPPSGITATRAEVMALNAKARPDPKRIEELIAAAIATPLAAILPDTTDVPQTPYPIWLWIMLAMLLLLLATAMYGFGFRAKGGSGVR